MTSATDRMTSDTSQPELSRRNTASWVLLTGGAQAVRFLATLASTAILARLLLPIDFGLVAAASPLLAFSALLQNLGLNEALIQRPQIGRGHVNALFVVTTGMSIAVALGLILAAPMLASLLLEPRLTGIIQAIAGISFVFAASTVPVGLMNRRLKFKQLAIVDVCSCVSGLVVGVAVAAATHSYWALLLMQATTGLVQLVGSVIFAGWKPGKPAFDPDFRRMISLGAGFSTFNLLNFLSRNADVFLIARVHGATALGFYERAYKIMLAPLWQTVTPFGRVLMPVLSRLQEDAAAYRQRYFEAVALLMTIVQPAILVAVVFPAAVLQVVLGPGWSPAVPIFFWLCLTALHQVQTSTFGWLFVSQGRAREFAVLGAAGAAIILTSFVVGLPYGPAGVAMAYAIADIALRAPLSWWMAGRHGPVDLAALTRSFFPHATSMAVVAVVLMFWGKVSEHLPAFSLLAGAACVSYASYVATLGLFQEKRKLILAFMRGARRRFQVKPS
jgi:PST family polysaccharide transporter